MDNNKLVHYRGFAIERIEHRGDYRVYKPEKPYQSIAYVDTIEEAISGIDEHEQLPSRLQRRM